MSCDQSNHEGRINAPLVQQYNVLDFTAEPYQGKSSSLSALLDNNSFDLFSDRLVSFQGTAE